VKRRLTLVAVALANLVAGTFLLLGVVAVTGAESDHRNMTGAARAAEDRVTEIRKGLTDVEDSLAQLREDDEAQRAALDSTEGFLK